MEHPNRDDEKRTVIEEGTEIEGRLRSKHPLVLRGAIEGDVDAPSIVVTPSGRLAGSAKVDILESQGYVAGHVEANEVTLLGTVGPQTTIRARTLEVKLSGDSQALEVTFGECTLEVGDDRASDSLGPNGHGGHGHPSAAEERPPAS